MKSPIFIYPSVPPRALLFIIAFYCQMLFLPFSKQVGIPSNYRGAAIIYLFISFVKVVSIPKTLINFFQVSLLNRKVFLEYQAHTWPLARLYYEGMRQLRGYY